MEQAVFIKAGNGRFTFITPNVADLLGFSVSDILNKTEIELFGSELGFESLEVDQRVSLTGVSSSFDMQIVVGSQLRKLHIVKHPYLAENGDVCGIIGTIQEVVEEHIELPELQRVTETDGLQADVVDDNVLFLYRRLIKLQSASSAISVSLDETRILEAYTWELTNLLDADECVVMRWYESENSLVSIETYQNERLQTDLPLTSLRYDLAEHPFLLRMMQERTANQWHFEAVNYLDDGQPYLTILGVQGLLALPFVFRERIIGLVLVLRHVAERPFIDLEMSLAQLLTDQVAGFVTNAWLFAELAEMNDSLRVSNAELDAFAHTVAHDLKSPLANTIGFASILSREKDTLSAEESQEFLSIISKNGKRMRGIIDGLLMLASVRKEDVVVVSVDMESVISEVLARLYYTIMESNAQISVETAWLNSLGYAPWLEEVWANYIGNAIKYGGKPPQITLGAEMQADGMVRYWVRDNGQGLTAEQQAKLFVPFTRLGIDDGRGHGLGLSIVERIVTRLDGNVGIFSEVGKGCVFYFTLPATP
jgi:signal transduction histidine kinase